LSTVDVEVVVSTPAQTDEAHDLLIDEIGILRTQLATLEGVSGPVRLIPDTTDPERQGGELLQFALELIPVALESLLVLIRAHRGRRRHPEEQKDTATEIAEHHLVIDVKLVGPAGDMHFTFDGQDDQVLPAAASILTQLTGSPAPHVK
jgi:hypothetical protein